MEPMSATAIVMRLVRDNRHALANVLKAKRVNDTYAADRDEWTVWAVVSDVVEMAHGFTAMEAQEFIRMVVGRD